MTMRLDPNMISILGPVNPSDQARSLPDQTTLTCKLWIADAFLMRVAYRLTHKLALSSRGAELYSFPDSIQENTVTPINVCCRLF